MFPRFQLKHCRASRPEVVWATVCITFGARSNSRIVVSLQAHAHGQDAPTVTPKRARSPPSGPPEAQSRAASRRLSPWLTCRVLSRLHYYSSRGVHTRPSFIWNAACSRHSRATQSPRDSTRCGDLRIAQFPSPKRGNTRGHIFTATGASHPLSPVTVHPLRETSFRRLAPRAAHG